MFYDQVEWLNTSINLLTGALIAMGFCLLFL